MAKINLAVIDDSIDKFTKEYYSKPVKIKVPKERLQEVSFFISMFNDRISNSLHKYELKGMNMVRIRDGDDKTKCISEKIIGELGRGSYGRVYKISDTVAVKLISLGGRAAAEYDHILTQKQDLKDFINNEYAIAKKAGDLGVGPKIYKMHSCCAQIEGCYVVMSMEYLDLCKTLYEVQDALPEKEVETLNKILSKKIRLLHANGIYHNDIHAGNVMVRFKNNAIIDAFIIDYGRATMDQINKRRAGSKDIAHIDEMSGDYNSNMKAYVVWRMMTERVCEFL